MRRGIAKMAALLTAVVLLGGLDQWSKHQLEFLQTSPLAWGPIQLVWHTNPGIAFSINLPISLAVILIVILLVILIRLWWRSGSARWEYQWGLLLVISGGISNLWDKLRWGAVRDFVAIGPLPVFNLADVWIFIGVILIIWGAIYGERQQKI